MLLVALGGSLRANSRSRAALNVALGFGTALGHETALLDVNALQLPMFVPNVPITHYAEAHQEAIQHLIDTCRRADAFVWGSPTYHGTVSGAFKNAIDFLEFLGDDARPYLQGRPVGLISVNDQTTFAAMSDIVHELRAWLAPTRVVVNRTHFSDDMTVSDAKVNGRLQRVVQEVMDFAGRASIT